MTLKYNLYPALILLFVLIKPSKAQETFTQKGMASYYGAKFQGKKTASGERFDMNEYTAAHPKLPFQSLVKVTNLRNNKSVVVRINDRGPFTKKRIIDLSKAAAAKIDLIREGTGKVQITVVNPEEDSIPKEKNESTNVEKGNDHVHNKEWLAGRTYNEDGEDKKPQGYGVQIASYSNYVNAHETIQKIKNEGIKTIYIEVLLIDEKKIFRIMAGEYSDITSAEKALDKIEELGYKGFVKKYRF